MNTCNGIKARAPVIRRVSIPICVVAELAAVLFTRTGGGYGCNA